MSSTWQRVASRRDGEDYAEVYARRFAVLAAQGQDVHGEARFVETFSPAPARVLDAGCGTGRVGAELARRGDDVVGCDVDPTMIAVARRDHSTVPWFVADLARLDATDLGELFDLVLLAGNVVPFLEPGTLAPVLRSLAAVLAPAGRVVAGFGLHGPGLPAGCDPVDLTEVDAAARAAGLVVGERWSTWDRAPHSRDDGYVVASFHQGGPAA